MKPSDYRKVAFELKNLNNSFVKIREMGSREARTFGPLFSLLLGSLLHNAVTAKYLPFQITYDPNPWLAYNKPLPLLNYYQKSTDWQPLEEFYPEINPSFTTMSSVNHLETIADLQPPPHPSYYENHYYDEHHVSTIQPFEPIPAESNINRRRHHNRKTTSRPRHPNYQQKRRRTTTPQPEYYDSYEDYDKPYYGSSYEEDNYYDSLEQTTKYYSKRKPSVIKRKKGHTTEKTYDDEEGQQTEIVIVRQRQQTTITEPPTFITNGTTNIPETTTMQNTTTTTNSTEGYGYGPSNGNDQISITYGPPFLYSAPYIDWYTAEATGNTIVKKVHDLLSFNQYSKKKSQINS